jgi:hypothetical protein
MREGKEEDHNDDDGLNEGNMVLYITRNASLLKLVAMNLFKPL